MGKKVHPQQGDQIRKRPLLLGKELKVFQDQDGNQCCPNLDLDCIGAGTDKSLDLQVLLQRLEKDLNLPAVLIDGRNRPGTQTLVVR